MDKFKKMVNIVFWCHFAVALFSHAFVIVMIGGVAMLLNNLSLKGFWETGLLLGITFFTAMYAINHVTEKGGFCVLTDLENYYRSKCHMPQVKEFTPRFYSKCNEMSRNFLAWIKRLGRKLRW